METKTRLCDVCKKKIMEYKCDICGCDICESCKDYDRLIYNNTTFAEIIYCRECGGKIFNLFKGKSISNVTDCVLNFKTELVDALKKNLIVENLK